MRAGSQVLSDPGSQLWKQEMHVNGFSFCSRWQPIEDLSEFGECIGDLSFVQSEYWKSKARSCFSIVHDNQAKGISRAGTLHGQVL